MKGYRWESRKFKEKSGGKIQSMSAGTVTPEEAFSSGHRPTKQKPKRG